MRLVLLAALLSPLLAAAQPAPPSDADGLPPGVAMGASVGVTAAAILGGLALDADDGARGVLWVVGGAVGPSAGNLIQGEWGDAAIGFGLRAGGTGMVLGAALGMLWNESDGQRRALEGLAVAGGVTVLAGAAYDVVMAGANARARRVEVVPGGSGLAVRLGL